MKQEDLLKKIISYWKEYDVFQKSVDQRSDKRETVMYDGPPFASGAPHFGHWLTSTMKDTIGRYKTMKWYKVVRNWWWDCHWLPVEKYVEKKLWIDGKKAIEKLGVENFVEECRVSVENTNDERKRFVDNLWRWADMDHAYFTMDLDFMESVIWVFQNLYNRNLVYKWFKIQWYCPSCATGLSNSEINDWYKDRQDPAVTVKFPLRVSKVQEEKLNPEFETTEDGSIKFVRAVMKDSDGKILLLLKKKFGTYIMPGGKVDSGENVENALTRELKEELWVSIVKKSFVGQHKAIYNYGWEIWWSFWEHHLYEVEYNGTPVNNETETHGQMVWADIVDSDNELWFAVKIEDNIIDDVDDIMKSFHSLYLYHNNIAKNVGSIESGKDAPFVALAWTTTPWTLPSNMFLAVGKFLKYVQIFDITTKEYYILAEALLNKYYKNKIDYILITKFDGEILSGMGYVPLFDYIKNSEIDSKYTKDFYQILVWDFVSTDTWTGIVHQAPAFGEDDFNAVCQILPQDKSLEWLFLPVDEYGEFSSLVPDFEGVRVYDANKDIIRVLKEQWKLVAQETVNHSYPHCWRCDTPLIYKAIDSWFIKEHDIAKDSIEKVEQINFVPELVKNRFRKTLETAPDWNVSRNRYWGAPLPIWEEEWWEDRIVVGSLNELYQKTRIWSQNITKHVFLRHGRTDFNDKKIYDGRWDSVLSSLGQKQAVVLVDNLQKEFVVSDETILVVSPLYRTFLTVLPVIEKQFDPVVVAEIKKNYEEVQQHFFSLWDGWELVWYLKDKTTQKQFVLTKNVLVDFRITDTIVPEFNGKEFSCGYLTERPNNQKLSPTGESVDEMYIRLSDYLDEMDKKHKTATIITVSHADNIVLMAKRFKNFIYNEKRNDYKPSNADIQTYYWDLDRNKEVDLHKPFVDNYWFVKNDKKYFRISEVFDCWFESGAMPYGQVNYLWDKNSKKFPYPADFIIEGLDQTRWWFRTLHVLGNGIMNQNAYNNVVVNGLILAEDGKKMSKKLKNYPDPKYLFYRYGSDAYRLYLLSSPAVRAEPVKFTEKWVDQVYKDFTASLTNACNFFETYANVDNFVFDTAKVFFVRHAEAEWTWPDAKLTKQGELSMNEEQFVEKVLRCDADIIYVSDFLRARKTAETIAKIIKSYRTEKNIKKDIEIKVDKDFAFSDNVILAYENLLKETKWKRVILVGHNFTLSSIWAKYYIHVDRVSGMGKNLEVVDLPTYHIVNDLDKWILAELHKLWKNIEENMDKYLLDVSAKHLLSFVEKLTNWYIRRSRRRFWASGMNEDKYSAYATLFTVLTTYLQLCAPFAPFISEELWLSLQKFTGNDKKWCSVHLQHFPLVSEFFVDEDLLDEITLVRRIISLGLFVRAKNNMKIKQPLMRMEVQV